MEILVELSLEHPSLPASELAGALDVLAGTLTATEPGIAIGSVPDAVQATELANRLGLAHGVDAYWSSVEPSMAAVLVALENRDLAGAEFAVRAKRLGGKHPDFHETEVARAAGGLLSKTGKVNLSSPGVEIRILVSDRAHIGARVHEIDRAALEARSSKNRPFFSPVSLHPRYALAMANLARVKRGDRVLDPFCGTGGLVLEAGRLGARVFASDLDPRMAAGTRHMLESFGVTDAQCEERDVGEAPDFAPQVDAILTDPPFGRNATTAREALESLYERFFAGAVEALRPGGRLVATFPGASHVDHAKQHLTLEEHHEIRVHRSLTRHLVVLVKE